MSEPAGRFLVALIGKPHGLAGESYLVPISDDPRRFEPGSKLQHESGRDLIIDTIRRHSADRFLVKFEGVASRVDADKLRGPLYVSADELRALEDEEYWSHDLVGLDVETVAGTHVGKVDSLVTNPAQDLLVVATSKGERYVPLVHEIVTSIDIAARRIVIDPPVGLLD